MAVGFDWIRAGELSLDIQGKLRFPSTPDEPGVYRFDVTALSGRSVYIGEADRLRRRFAHYRGPGPTQSTNIRINEAFRRTLAEGDTVQVSVLTAATVAVDGAPEVQLDLRRESSRRLVENAALAAAYLEGAARIINASRVEELPRV